MQRDRQYQQNLYHTERQANIGDVHMEEVKANVPGHIQIKHSEVNMNPETPVYSPRNQEQAAPPQDQEQVVVHLKKPKQPKEQDASVFLTGMDNNSEMDDEDWSKYSIHR